MAIATTACSFFLLAHLVLHIHAFCLCLRKDETASLSKVGDAKARWMSDGVIRVGIAPSQKLHAPCYAYTPGADDTFGAALLSFLEAHQARGVSDNVEIGVSDSSGLRGLFAKRGLQRGECVCSVPFAASIVLDRNYSNNTTDAQLGASFLRGLLDNEEASNKWKPYLDVLPKRDKHFDPTPDFLSNDEILSLQFPTVIQRAMERKQQIVATSLLEGTDLESLMFATWLVSSRKFTITRRTTDQAVQQSIVLIPFLDMINHASHERANTRLKVVEKEALYTLESTCPIEAQEEITMTYGTGKETPADLFVTYGFLPGTDNKSIKAKGSCVVKRLLFNK